MVFFSKIVRTIVTAEQTIQIYDRVINRLEGKDIIPSDYAHKQMKEVAWFGKKIDAMTVSKGDSIGLWESQLEESFTNSLSIALLFKKLSIIKRVGYGIKSSESYTKEASLTGFISARFYLARRLDYKPKWAYIAYSSLEENHKLGHFPEGYSEPPKEPPRQPKQESYSYIDPLSSAIAFFGLERGFTGSELKRVYRSLAIRCHPDFSNGFSCKSLPVSRLYG